MKRERISSASYNLIMKQLARHQKEGRISQEQMLDMLRTYEVIEGINFIKVLVNLGAILVGLGVLSVIASNWIYIGKLLKFLIIVGGYLVVNFFSYYSREKYPKTSRAFFYLGILIYGAGIFLVGQMFNFSSFYTSAFLLWAIGIFPLTILVKDKWALGFLHILLLIYLNEMYFNGETAVVVFFIMPLLYLSQLKIRSGLNFFMSSVVTLNFLWIVMDNILGFAGDLLLFIYFLIGLGLFVIKPPDFQEVIHLLGNIIFTFSGFLLTFDFIWQQPKLINVPINIIFSLSYVLILLFFIQRQNLLALIFLGLTIFRFYFDVMYDFMNKSIFFLVGGLILLGFGYFFERKRSILRRGEIEK